MITLRQLVPLSTIFRCRKWHPVVKNIKITVFRAHNKQCLSACTCIVHKDYPQSISLHFQPVVLPIRSLNTGHQSFSCQTEIPPCSNQPSPLTSMLSFSNDAIKSSSSGISSSTPSMTILYSPASILMHILWLIIFYQSMICHEQMS